MKIKICGVNDAAFAAEAEALGADYIGVIFAPSSPRRVDEETARGIVRALRDPRRAVGVFTSAPVDEILATAKSAGLSTVQLHRRATAEDVSFLKSNGLAVWTLAGGAAGDAVLFDSSHGDGETALAQTPGAMSVLAGGISEDNVAEAAASGADAIDVSGSLETAPGVKSVEKLRRFFAKAAPLARSAALAAAVAFLAFAPARCAFAVPQLKPQPEVIVDGELKAKVLAASKGVPPATPEATTYRVTVNGDKRLVRTYDPVDLWRVRAEVGTWKDRKGNVMRLARVVSLAPDGMPPLERTKEAVEAALDKAEKSFGATDAELGEWKRTWGAAKCGAFVETKKARYWVEFEFAEDVKPSDADKLLKAFEKSVTVSTWGAAGANRDVAADFLKFWREKRKAAANLR